MTEAEWLVCEKPGAMLIFLRGEVSAQEQAASKGCLWCSGGRLFDGPSPIIPSARFIRFVAACVARLQRLPLSEHASRYLDVFQRFADGQATVDELRHYWSAMDAATKEQRCAENYLELGYCDTPLGAGRSCWYLAGAFAWTVARDSIAVTCAEASEDDWFNWGWTGPPDPLFQDTERAEIREQAHLLREVIGNPFRPIHINESWLTWNEGLVTRIARAIDEEQSFDGMPILADALEEAGCHDSEILTHCRQHDNHVHGCWLIDALTGRG